MERRIVGLDLGVATDHTAVILDETGTEVARRRVRPTRASLQALRAAALVGAQTETVVEVVIEPTGPVWLPVAVFFAATDDVVYRVSATSSIWARTGSVTCYPQRLPALEQQRSKSIATERSLSKHHATCLRDRRPTYRAGRHRRPEGYGHISAASAES